MNINLNNYEAYFLDYHEGSLSPALVKELMDFLSQHPELKEEFEGFELIALNHADGIKFEGKELLKKSTNGITASNFEEYAIEYFEGTLSPVLQNELKIFIKENPRYQSELELFAKTKLVPDSIIVFENKHILKRSNRRPAAYYYWSAAASVAIIIASYFILHKSVTPSGNNIVKNNQKPDSTVVVKQLVKLSDTNTVVHTNNRVSIAANPEKHLQKTTLVAKKSTYAVKIVGIRKSSKIHSLKSIDQKVIPLEVDSSTVAFFKSEFYDVTNWMDTYKYVNSNFIPQQYTVIEPEKVKKKNKLLVKLATITCKGLHSITGQHIELEKKFDSDTTNIIAYQLDLGHKKIEFPVKD